MSSAPVRPGPADGVRPLAARGEPLLSFNQTAHLVLEWLAEVRSARQSAQQSVRPSALPMVLGLAIEGRPNIRAIEDALNEIVRRHDVLRMSVPDPRRLPPAREAALAAALSRDGIVHAGLFTPRIRPVASLSLSVETIPITGASEQTSHLEARIREAIERPFDYAQPPLMRATLFTLDADRHTLVVVLHHLVADAWSVGVLRGELERLYDCRVTGRSFDLLAPPLQYSEFARQEREQFHPIDESLVTWWRAHWAAYGDAQITPADLPPPRLSTSVDEIAPGFQSRSVDPARLAAVRAFGKRCRVTTYVLGLSAMAILFHAYTRRSALAWWGYCSNRTSTDRESLIGWVAHGWLFGITVVPDQSVLELIRSVRDCVYEMYDYEQVPVQIWWQILHEHRLAAPDAFGEQFVSFDAFVASSNDRVTLADGVVLRAEPRVLLKTGRWPSLGVWSVERGAALVFDCRYASTRCAAGAIATFLEDLELVLGAMADEPELPVSALASRFTIR